MTTVTAATTTPLDSVLRAWVRYVDLRAAGALLGERLAAWSALQDARRAVRSGG